MTKKVGLLLALIVLAAEAIAACGSSSPAGSTSASPSAASNAHFSVPTATFTSSTLGISFRYPASWRLDDSTDAAATFAKDGLGTLAVHSPKNAAQPAGLLVGVSSAIVLQGRPPRPFASVSASDVRDWPTFEQQAKLPPSKAGLVTVDGLHLLALDMRGNATPYWGHGRWRERDLFSRGEVSPPWATRLQLGLLAPAKQWRADQPLFSAILASIRLSTPTGVTPQS